MNVVYVKESIPQGPEGIILESVMEGLAEYYSANLSQNIRRGNYDSALKRQTLGQTLLGLRKAPDGTFEPDPITAPVVKRIFEEYAGGKSSADICRDLNMEGYRTIRGNKFGKNAIPAIIKNEKYMGVYRYEDIYDENGIPPIVDKDLFMKAQQKLKTHKEAPALKKDEGGYLLTPKLVCGECGEKIVSDCGTGKSGKVYQYYVCNNVRLHKGKCTLTRAPKQLLEDVVVAALIQVVHNDAVINEFADRFMVWQERELKENLVLENLKSQLRKTETGIKNLSDVIAGGAVLESLINRLKELEEDKKELEKAIILEEKANPKLSREAVVWFLESFRNGDAESYKWRMYLVETFLDYAYLYADGRLVLQLNYTGNKNTVALTPDDINAIIREGRLLCSDYQDLAEKKGFEPLIPL